MSPRFRGQKISLTIYIFFSPLRFYSHQRFRHHAQSIHHYMELSRVFFFFQIEHTLSHFPRTENIHLYYVKYSMFLFPFIVVNHIAILRHIELVTHNSHFPGTENSRLYSIVTVNFSFHSSLILSPSYVSKSILTSHKIHFHTYLKAYSSLYIITHRFSVSVSRWTQCILTY